MDRWRRSGDLWWFCSFYQIIRTVLLTSPAPNAHQDCCFSRPPGSFKATVRYLPLMRTNEGPKWSYYKASLNRDNTSGENTLQNGERDCSGSTVLITQHNLSCFFSHMFSLFLCPSTSYSFYFHQHAHIHTLFFPSSLSLFFGKVSGFSRRTCTEPDPPPHLSVPCFCSASP